MSIEVEMHRKAGRVCKQAIEGSIHCPLIVRPTSEDVVVGNVFGMLKQIRPHLWLNGMLNAALGCQQFRQVWFKDFSIRFWERQERFPPELLGFKEGRTEPDIVIEWENPPTTVWIEAKWLSPFSERTSRSMANDQILRGVRTLLAHTGHIQTNRLFRRPLRRPYWLALTYHDADEFIQPYRSPTSVAARLSAHVGGDSLPRSPFVGCLTWLQLAQHLRDWTDHGAHFERSNLESASEYIKFKCHEAPRSAPWLFTE